MFMPAIMLHTATTGDKAAAKAKLEAAGCVVYGFDDDDY